MIPFRKARPAKDYRPPTLPGQPGFFSAGRFRLDAAPAGGISTVIRLFPPESKPKEKNWCH
jgi:hypothetical protein